ncbi:MAG TPA: GAF domain-containing protein [Nakamurella sp.]
MRRFETAFGSGDTSAEYRALLDAVHAAFLDGRRAPAQPRQVIGESWTRVRRTGLNPAVGGLPGETPDMPAAGAPVGPECAGEPSAMAAIVPVLRRHLDPLLDDDQTLLVIADEKARVLARFGGRGMSRHADEIGFRPGLAWSERTVGTNAIGTALVTGGPVQVHAAEHFCFAQQGWSCAAAPVFDPRSGRVLGAIDLSFLAGDAHPSAVSLASSLARQAELELRDAHRRSLDRLRRATSGPGTGPWVLVDRWGWIADASDPGGRDRLALPDELTDGACVLVEGLGAVEVAAMPGGWLLSTGPARGSDRDQPRVRLRADPVRCEVTVASRDSTWTRVLTGRRAQIVAYLADHPNGMTAGELAATVYGSSASAVAVRAEVHRIRRAVGGLIETNPYRLAAGVSRLD